MISAEEKRLQTEQARVQTQCEDILNKINAEKRGMTPEERETWNRLVDADNKIDEQRAALKKEQDQIEAMTKKIAAGKLANNPGGISDFSIDGIDLNEYRLVPKAIRERNKAFENDAHARAFHNFLVQHPEHGDTRNGLSDDDRKVLSRMTIQNAQSTSVGSAGGDLVPQGFSDILTEAMLWFGGIDGVVDQFDTSTGNPMPWPTANDTTNKGRIIGQNAQAAETDVVFSNLTFNSYIGSSDIVLIPYVLMQDSYFDMDALLARLLGTRLGRLLNWKGTTGTGTGEPTGIVTAAVTAGNVLTLGAGNTASISYLNLVDLQHSVDPAYREKSTARWMFSDTMLKLLKKLVDGQNRPLWQPGLTASFRQGAAVKIDGGMGPEILDKGYVINQDMAVPAANAYSMLFGDVSCYKIRRVAGGITLQRLVERYADYLQVGYQAYMRFDGNLVDAGTHPIAVLQQSAT